MKFSLTVLFSILIVVTSAQKTGAPNDSLLGTWTGTSICQVKPSPCNDEIAAYHITNGTKPNTYRMLMNKVINGKEEEMGTIEYDFDAAKQILSYRDVQRNTLWTFNVHNGRMDGTLVYNNQVYRVIKLTKADQ